MFWGLSESLDLFEEYLRAQTTKAATEEAANCEEPANTDANCGPAQARPPPEELNVLIFGAGDPRHLIKTMAKRYAHSAKGARTILNVFTVDGCVEVVARSIALLGIALESPQSMSLRNKVHLFMDVYGNSLLRSSSHNYLAGKARTLIKMVTDEEVMKRLAPFLSIEGLKYRERDGLENALHFWLPKEGHVFNVQEYWSSRLRKLMGVRYDHREGAFDWDLNMTLKDREAKQICSQEYRYWRETGIAFTFPEYEYSKPNKTLSAGLVRNGERYVHRGYVGDLQTGPFAAFGLKTADERMLKSVHGENDFRATDVTERNLLELFHELATHTPYDHDLSQSRRYGSVKLLMGKSLTHEECCVGELLDYDKPWIGVGGIEVNFLSADDIFTLQEADGRWRDFFDVAFVGCNYFSFLKDSFVKVLRHRALLIVETKLLTLARGESVAEFEVKLMDFAKRTKMSPLLNYNVINAKHTILKFVKTTNAK